MYLRMGFNNRSQVDIQLDREECTLEDLFDEDELVQEAKAHNMKLIEFLVKKKNLTRLINYVSIEPNLEEIKKKKEKKKDSEKKTTDDGGDKQKNEKKEGDDKKENTSEEKVEEKKVEEKKENDVKPEENKEEKTEEKTEEKKEEKTEEKKEENGQDKVEDKNDVKSEEKKEEKIEEEKKVEEIVEIVEETKQDKIESKKKETTDEFDEYEEEEEDDEDDEKTYIEKMMLKYPQLSCDILSCDIEIIYDEIVSNDSLMDLLFAFLKKKNPNPNFESNWIKVVLAIFQRKPFKVLKYIYNNKGLVKEFIDHIGTFDLQELLLRLMGCEPVDEDENQGGSISLSSQMKLKMFNSKDKEFNPHSIAQWWMEQNVIDLLFAKMDPQFEEEVHTHTTFVVAEFILRSTKDLESDINPLAKKFLSKETVGKFMDVLLKYSNSTVLIEGIPLLSVFIETGFNIMITRKEKKIPESILLILYKVKDLVAFLKDPGNVQSITTPVETLKVPMGSPRLKIIEFLSQLFRINSPTVEKELIKAQIVPVVIDLVLKYEYNNFLHNLFLSLVGYILGGESDTIKKHLLFDCKLCDVIIKGYGNNKESLKQTKGMRKGYVGHFTIIANKLISESQEIVIEALKQCKGWTDFVKSDLESQNSLESKQLGGPLPTAIDSDHDDFEKHFQGFDEEEQEEGGGGGQNQVEDDFEDDEYRIDDDEDSSEEEETMVKHDEAYDMSDSDSDPDSDDETFVAKQKKENFDKNEKKTSETSIEKVEKKETLDQSNNSENTTQ